MDRRLYWDAQNLNERKQGPDGPMWRHGRAWLHFPENGKRDRCLGMEWVLFGRSQGLKLGLEINQTFGAEYDVSSTVSLGWVGALYLNLTGFFPRCWKGDSKDTSISLYAEYLWINFWWADPALTWGENKNRFPSFRISFDWQSFLFGKQHHRLEWLSGDGEWWANEAESNWHPIEIPMPEALYPARYRIERRTWHRSRWPKKLVKVAADIDLRPHGVPIPGKGENSYDQGEDAIMGMGSSDTSEAGIIAAVVKSAMERRARYETIHWVPMGRKSR